MPDKQNHNPLLWIPSLCAAREIPTAVITFVVLLMFLQFGESMAMSALYSALLFLPFALQSFFRRSIRAAGNYKFYLHLVEGAIFFLLILMEVAINHLPFKNWMLFILAFAISTMCAWHDVLGREYYNSMLNPRQQKVYNKTRLFASQITVVLTYGVLIIFVGFLEVIFRMPTEALTKKLAWAMECYIIAGAYLVFFLANFLVIKPSGTVTSRHHPSVSQSAHKELSVVENICSKSHSLPVLASLFFLLLPQALMFYTRVFYLLSKAEEGGLDCSVPDVGFAQGTIGVLAFAFGLLFGRSLMARYGMRRMFWYMVISLTLSPTFYMLMSIYPQHDNIFAICLMCMLAQLCFGFGLNICIAYVRHLSSERYSNYVDYLYIPLIAAMMILPMAISGWICQTLGFRTFFVVDASFAVVAWIVLGALNIREKLEHHE